MRQRTPWYWPEFLFNTIGPGKQHDHCLKIMHDFTEKVGKSCSGNKGIYFTILEYPTKTSAVVPSDKYFSFAPLVTDKQEHEYFIISFVSHFFCKHIVCCIDYNF